MKNLEIVKIKVENLRELFKFLLLSNLTFISAIVSLNLYVLVKKLPIYFVIFDLVAIVVEFLLIKVTIFVFNKMDELIKEVK
ncbi:hypothetical protein JCM11957_12380 [Caminibacter profundus]